MYKSRMKIWEASLLLALCFSLCLGTWAQAKQSSLSSSLVRLHVIAVSDDEYEQALKLRVRDGVLSYISPKLRDVKSAQQAQEIIKSELDGIKAAAESSAEGRSVEVTLSQEYYPTRNYEKFSLPAGKYQSLRVILGEGEGHNWWCVVFPPLCLSAAEQEQAVESMSEDMRGIVTEEDGCEYKFRILELWGELMELIGV
ncbi:MAG: stage II sporulation protein R [Oscillospiraceae bacterium]|nr:stage II sporulation protein R [Oscillospiraceae bacterium]